MRPVCARSLAMSIATSPSEPRTMGSSISLPSHFSTAGGSDIRWLLVDGEFARLQATGARKPNGRVTRSQQIGAISLAWIGPGSGCQTRRSMDFDLSDDQRALRDGARELLDGLASPARVRAHAESG